MRSSTSFWQRHRALITSSIGVAFNLLYLLKSYLQYGPEFLKHLSQGLAQDLFLYLGLLALIPIFIVLGVMVSRAERERERFETLFESARDGIYVRDAAGTMKLVNQKFLEIHGLRLEDVLGRRSLELLMLTPEERQRLTVEMRQALLKGEPPPMVEAPFRRPDGTTGWLQINVAFLKEAGQVKEVLGIIRDITERKQTELLIAGQNRVLALLAQKTPLRKVLEELCRAIEEQSPGTLCSVLLLEGERLRYGAAPSLPESYNQAIDGLRIGPNVGSCGSAASRKELVIVADTLSDPLWADFRDLAKQYGLRACWSMPILSQEREVLGTFAVYYREPRQPTSHELEIIQQAVHLAAIALERHQSDEQLRASEERHRLLFEQNLAGVFRATLDGRILDCNEAFARIMGCASRAEMRSQHALSFYFDPADREAYLKQLQEKGSVANYELRMRRKDGTPLWVLENVNLTEDGTIIQGTLIDITERKRTEAALQRRDDILAAVGFAAEQLLRASDWRESIQRVLARLGAGAAVSRVYIFENHRGANGELLTSQRYEWSAPGIAAQLDNPQLQNFPWEAGGFARWAKTLSQGQHIQGHVRDFPQSERAVLEAQAIKSLVAFPIFVKQDWWGFIGFDECLAEREWHQTELEALRTAADAIGATIQRQHAEEVLQRSQEQLRASEERYRDLIEHANDAIYTLDVHGRFTSFNRKAEEITGYKLGEVLGRPYTLLIRGLERHKARRAFVKNLRGEANTTELTITRKDGQTAILELSSRPIWREGRISGIQGIARDITEKKALERLQQEFVSTVSHELRTPLTSIKGYVDLVLAGDAGPLTPEQAEFLKIVAQNTTRLTSLINDLLDIQKLETGRIEFEFGEVSLSELLRELAQAMRLQAAEKDLSFSVELEPALTVRGDRERLAQVFNNLLSNAIKYTPAGGVTLRARRTGHSVAVSVSDTGIGLSEKDLQKLFQKFYRSDNPYVRKAGGTGLGLAISKAILERHGGTIEVSSQPDQGSTFTVWLPAPAPAETTTLARPTVLVIDDELAIAKLIAKYIERMDYHAETACTAHDGLAKAVQLKPQLITLDVLMPDMDGFTLIQKLKSHPETAHIPVIFLSIVQDRLQGLRLGASAYLTKPIDEKKFSETVRNLLDSQGQPVLVVDDDPDFAKLLQRLLQREGWHAEIAHDGAAALAKLRAKPYQLVLLDKHMPKRSGLEVLQELRNQKALAHVPVILMSGSDQAEKLAQSIEILGAKRFLSKKLSPQALVQEIVAFLEKEGARTDKNIKI